jgi:hypothetical protein
MLFSDQVNLTRGGVLSSSSNGSSKLYQLLQEKLPRGNSRIFANGAPYAERVQASSPFEILTEWYTPKTLSLTLGSLQKMSLVKLTLFTGGESLFLFCGRCMRCVFTLKHAATFCASFHEIRCEVQQSVSSKAHS